MLIFILKNESKNTPPNVNYDLKYNIWGAFHVMNFIYILFIFYYKKNDKI